MARAAEAASATNEHVLAPGRGPKIAPHLPQQGIFLLIPGVVLAAQQGKVHRDAQDAPLGHQEHEAQATDVRMMRAEPGGGGHGMLFAALAFEGTVADERAQPIGGWGQGLHSLVGAPPQQRFGPPRGSAQQAALMLVRQVPRAMAAQRLEVGPFAV